MAKITPEMIEQINEIYAECGVKTQTAKRVGVSVASVNKYLIDGYVPIAQRQVVKCDIEIPGIEEFTEKFVKAVEDGVLRELWENVLTLSEEEKEELIELQKEAI